MTAKEVISRDLPSWSKQHSSIVWYASVSIRFRAKVIQCNHRERRGLLDEAERFIKQRQMELERRRFLEEFYAPFPIRQLYE